VPISTTEDYERAVAVVRGVLHEWDPYALLAGGAPADEFDHEVAQLVARSRGMESRADAARAVSEVFSESFEARHFTLESCTDVGNRLFAALSAAGLLPTTRRKEGAV